MSNLYRRPSLDVSCQVSVHLRRKIMFRNCSEFSVMFRICSEFSAMFRIFSNVQNFQQFSEFLAQKLVYSESLD
jgi:hypothetical protein